MTALSWPFATLLAVSLIATGGMVFACWRWEAWREQAITARKMAEHFHSNYLLAMQVASGSQQKLDHIHAQRTAAARKGHIAQSAIAAARKAGK